MTGVPKLPLDGLLVLDLSRMLPGAVLARQLLDLGAILGLGFPPFRGGPFRHVDTVGRGAIASRLEKLAEKYGRRFEPASMLTETVENPGKFYS